jgi:hypothetical protein
MPRYEVFITRRVVEMVSHEVEADNAEDAEEMAFELAKLTPQKFYFYDLNEDNYEIHDTQRLADLPTPQGTETHD